MRTDPLATYIYKLDADYTTIAFLKQATFPTEHLFEFEASFPMDQRFIGSLSSHGSLPFHRWSLVTLDLSLQAIGRLEWTQARLARMRFPALDVQSTAPLHAFFQMAVAGVREVNPGGEGGGQATTASVASSGTRRDPLPSFLFEWKIDGLGTLFVSRVDAFYVGDGASNDLTLTISPEASAAPFRDWLRNGNTPKNGSLILLDTALRAYYTIRFTGLRVQSVNPAFTTHSSNPATVRLTYSGIYFGDKK